MILYIRQGCHLCEAFLEELARHNNAWLDKLTVVDVDDSEQTVKIYGDRVPAIVHDGQLVCEYFFDPEQLSPYFLD